MKAIHLTYIVLGFAAVAGGIYLLLRPQLLPNVEPTYRIFFAIIAILYGVYRAISGVVGIRKQTTVLESKNSIRERRLNRR